MLVLLRPMTNTQKRVSQCAFPFVHTNGNRNRDMIDHYDAIESSIYTYLYDIYNLHLHLYVRLALIVKVVLQ